MTDVICQIDQTDLSSNVRTSQLLRSRSNFARIPNKRYKEFSTPKQSSFVLIGDIFADGSQTRYVDFSLRYIPASNKNNAFAGVWISGLDYTVSNLPFSLSQRFKCYCWSILHDIPPRIFEVLSEMASSSSLASAFNTSNSSASSSSRSVKSTSSASLAAAPT